MRINRLNLFDPAFGALAMGVLLPDDPAGPGTEGAGGATGGNPAGDGTGGGSGTGGDPAGEGGKAPTFKGEYDPEAAARLAANLRGEVAKEKGSRQKVEQQLQDVLKALGLNTDGKPDPAQLQTQLSQVQAERRQAQLEMAVLRTSSRLGADPDRVLDSRTLLGQLAELDPSSADFGQAVEAAITAAVEKNPWLKGAAAAGGPGQEQQQLTGTPRSGGDMTPGPGGVQQVTEAELQRMTPDEIAAAMQAGRLKNLL